MKKLPLYDKDGHSWIMFARDPERGDSVIDTNEYVIKVGDEALLLDPGGLEVFPQILTAITSVIEVEQIKAYLCSHQDPDVMSSLALWLNLTPQARIYLPWLWSGFIAHFGGEYVQNFELLPDEGGSLDLAGKTFHFIPAHHCHSAGNMHFYDPEAGILFSGDVGAGLVPHSYGMFVENFDDHIQYIDGFHRRWMPSSEALRVWVSRVRKLQPRMICPQHGSIYAEENVTALLDWLEDLEVGRVKKYA